MYFATKNRKKLKALKSSVELQQQKYLHFFVEPTMVKAGSIIQFERFKETHLIKVLFLYLNIK